VRRRLAGLKGWSVSSGDPIAGHLRGKPRKGNASRDNGGVGLSGDEENTRQVSQHGGTGHRARLRQRLLEGGAEALADYEVLEYLLFSAQARGDTKPLAKALLARFGSLAAVLDAEPGALRQIKGISDASIGALKIAALAARRMARSQVREQPVLGSWQALLDYLAIDMAHLVVERVRVLYLDARNRLVSDHWVGDGTVDEAAIHPREVIRRGLDLGATALILVHNHPSGNPEPSRADIQITQKIAEAGRLLGITVHDHVIVGREGHVSLRAKGLI
jgi:DNA repair protein RadC